MEKEYLVRVGGVFVVTIASSHEEAIKKFNDDVETISEGVPIEVFDLKAPTKYVCSSVYKKAEEGPKGKNGKTK